MKKGEKPQDGGQVGRVISKEGKDLGDQIFHERFLDMKPEDEAARLKDLAEFVKNRK